MEYRKNFLERRRTEVYIHLISWFQNPSLRRWPSLLFYYDGYAWLWLMLVQLLHLIPERFLTFNQHAQEWILGVWVKWRKHYAVLLALDTCIKSQGRPVCSRSRCAPGVGDGLSCALSGKKWNQQQTKRKQGFTRNKVFFFYPQQHLLQALEINSSTPKNSLLKKMIYLADHPPEKNWNEYTESILWLYLVLRRDYF